MDIENPYNEPLRLLRAHLQVLKKKRAELGEHRADVNVELGTLGDEITSLELVIEGASELAGEPKQTENIAALGLSAAVKAILQKVNAPMRPIDVEARLLQEGYNFRGNKDPLSSVVTILKRLASRGDATASSDGVSIRYAAPPKSS